MAQPSDGLISAGQTLGLSLDRYQEIMQICPSPFNGLLRTDKGECCDCTNMWTQTDRDALATALLVAEEMREKELGYHVVPKYLTGEVYQGYDFPLILDKKMLVDIGVRAVTTIQAGVALTLSAGGVINDPVTITVATTVTDVNEIIITYPGEDYEILPTKKSIAGGTLTVKIPRPRLIKIAVAHQCDPEPRYDDDANFIASVDVKRVYTDPSSGTYAVWTNMQKGMCCASGSVLPGEDTQQLFAQIDNIRTSIVKLYPAAYNAGVWTSSSMLKCYRPDFLRVSYKSGRRNSLQTELDTARLAHTLLPGLMPDRMNICSCWFPDLVVDPSNRFTPYGGMVGAVKVWIADSRSKVGYGSKFPRTGRN